MNAQKFKTHFPFFSSAKRPTAVYLDNAATTHKPKAVIDAMVDFYTNHNANVHRSLYDLGEGTTTLYEQAREKIAHFINAKHPEEIIFTSGTTEGINFIASTWAAATLKAGDHILLSQAEHHANLLPWQQAAKNTGAALSFIEVDPKTYEFKLDEPRLASLGGSTSSPRTGLGSPRTNVETSRTEIESPQIENNWASKADSFKSVRPELVEGFSLPDLFANTKLVAITAESNVLGPVWNHKTDQLKKFIDAAHQAGAKVLLDAAQMVAHTRIDVQHLNADFVVFSGHKMFGPTGIGVLYIKRELHDAIPPYQRGGSMVHSVSFTSATWARAPQKFEAGTPPIAQAIGLGAAVDYLLEQVDFESLAKHEASLCAYLIAGLESLPGISIAGNQDRTSDHGHLVSFAVEGIHAHDLSAYLSGHSIAVRAGHHCAQPLINHLGFESLVRASVALYNSAEDIQHFLEALSKGIKLLKQI